MTTWAREELAWLAGLIEGEASIATVTYKRTGLHYPRLVVQMTDVDVLRRAQALAGVGNVTGPYPGHGPRGHLHTPTWRWHCQRTKEVIAVLYAVWPWLGCRRRAQAESVIRSWRDETRSRTNRKVFT